MKPEYKRNLRPKKHLGQNFLVNKNVVHRIIRACQIQEGEPVLEIGPGLGGLTVEISKYTKNIFAIEKDKELFKELSCNPLLEGTNLINADFMNFDLSTLPEDIKVIGNLPFNLSTPIIERLIINRQRLNELFLTVQFEFGKRLCAKVSSKDYGALSCYLQYYSKPEVLFKIPSSCFYPQPKVTSCFVRIKFREPIDKVMNEHLLFKIIRQAFQQRRKRITNSLGTLFDKEDLTQILASRHISTLKRAENLTLKNYVDIANLYVDKK